MKIWINIEDAKNFDYYDMLWLETLDFDIEVFDFDNGQFVCLGSIRKFVAEK